MWLVTTLTALGLRMFSGVQRTLRVVTWTFRVLGEGAEEGGEVLGAEERFVALDVDVDAGGVGAGRAAWTRSEPLGSEGGEVRRDGPAVQAAQGEDFF